MAVLQDVWKMYGHLQAEVLHGECLCCLSGRSSCCALSSSRKGYGVKHLGHPCVPIYCSE